MIDSGVSANDHNIFDTNVVYAQDFTGSGTTADVYGHGTHVAGIIAARGVGWYANGTSTNTNYVGIAKGANIINLKVLNSAGQGQDSWVINAINRAIALKNTYNIRVINLSLGRPFSVSYKSDPLCQAVEAAWKAGIVVVVAAGNDGRNNAAGNLGYGTINAPGNDPYVITVGAMKTNGTPARGDDTIATYSSKGPTLIDHVAKPDLVAPGNMVLSDAGWNYGQVQCGSTVLCAANTIWVNYYSIVAGPLQQFMRLSGTSMATPVVSSAAAILIQKDPTLTPDQVKARLMKTAFKQFPASSVGTDPVTGIAYTSYYDIFTVGAGYLDIAAALSNNDRASAQALSPSVSKASNGTTALVTGTGVVWGTGLVWGTGVVWGTNLINGTGVVWGTNAVAGSGVVWGTTAVQSTGLVWGTGTSLIDASSILVNGER